MQELGIEHRQYGESLIASTRLTVQARAELLAALERLRSALPEEAVAGPPFAIFHFVSSVTGGSDVEVGFPVRWPVETAEQRTRLLPALDGLSLRHRGPLAALGQSYGRLHGFAAGQGMISDEFGREVYHDVRDAERVDVEIQFIIHDWNALLARHTERVLGADGREAVMQGGEAIGVETPLEDRFEWVKGALDRLDGLATEGQQYDILSSCAHVFPAEQVDKLRAVYDEARARTGDRLLAVDAVIAFMDADPGWAEGSRREGHTIYAAKGPRDPQAYAGAQTDAERRQAYCFCPIVRSHLDGGMPVAFCYCGSGWYRRQWEGATGQAVTIDVVKSILKGGDVCEFAIHLPE